MGKYKLDNSKWNGRLVSVLLPITFKHSTDILHSTSRCYSLPLSLSLFLLKFNERVNQLEICYKLKWYFTMRNRVYVRFPFLYYVTVTVNFDYVVFLFNQIRHQRINHDHHQHYWLYNQSCRVKMTVEGVWCLCVLVCLWVCVGGWVSEWVEEE